MFTLKIKNISGKDGDYLCESVSLCLAQNTHVNTFWSHFFDFSF